MPNWVRNIVEFSGNEEVIARMREEIRGEGEDRFIDFNKISPIPKELGDTQSPLKIISQEEYDKQEERITKGELTENEKNWGLSRGLTQELANEYREKFGATDWYSWQLENWGTKWNASDCIEFDDCIEFNTAWSTPFNLLVALSKKYPEIYFNVRYSDEDFGYNVGEYDLKNGEEVECNIPNGGTDEAYEMAMVIQYGGINEYFECNEEVFGDDYIEEDDINLSAYVNQMVELAYRNGYYPYEDCNFHKLALERFKELALSDENFELLIIIDKELSKVEN
jgi:hypothetical protein